MKLAKLRIAPTCLAYNSCMVRFKALQARILAEQDTNNNEAPRNVFSSVAMYKVIVYITHTINE